MSFVSKKSTIAMAKHFGFFGEGCDFCGIFGGGLKKCLTSNQSPVKKLQDLFPYLEDHPS